MPPARRAFFCRDDAEMSAHSALAAALLRFKVYFTLPPALARQEAGSRCRDDIETADYTDKRYCLHTTMRRYTER